MVLCSYKDVSMYPILIQYHMIYAVATYCHKKNDKPEVIDPVNGQVNLIYACPVTKIPTGFISN